MKRAAAATAAAGLLLLGALFATPVAAAATHLVATGFLAVTTGSGSSQISSFQLDGSGKKQLTSGSANHYSPSLSPDGKQILFSGEDGGAFEVYRMNIDGSGVIPITKPPAMAGTASWSPDGSAIAYAGLVAGKYQIFSAGPDGSNPVQLTHDAQASGGSPSYSPDGTTIAYSSSTTEISRIWVMKKDGSAPRSLSAGPSDAYPAWVGNSSLLFARSSNQGKGSAIFSVTLAGVEKAQSPADRFITEPRPLPGGKSYGATLLTGTSLGLVKVSRSDGAPIAALSSAIQLVATTTDGGFLLDPIAIQDGDVFTITWVLMPQAVPAPPSSAVPGPVPAGGSGNIFIIVVIGVLVLLLLIFGGVYLVGTPKTRERPPPPPPPPHDCKKEQAASDAAAAVWRAAAATFEKIDPLKVQAAAAAEAAVGPKAAFDKEAAKGPLASSGSVVRWSNAYLAAKAAADAAQARSDSASAAYEAAGGDTAWQAASDALSRARSAMNAADAALRACGDEVAAHADDPVPGTVSPPPKPPPPPDAGCVDGAVQLPVTVSTMKLTLYAVNDLRVERGSDFGDTADAKKMIDLFNKAQPFAAGLVNKIPGAGLGIGKLFDETTKAAGSSLEGLEGHVKRGREIGATATVYCLRQDLTATCTKQMVCKQGVWVATCSVSVAPEGAARLVSATAYRVAATAEQSVNDGWKYFNGLYESNDNLRKAFEKQCEEACH